MKLLLCLSLILLAFLPAAADVNVTGNWSGTFTMIGPNGETKDTGALLTLKQNGAEITGTVGPDDHDRFDIKKGSIDGDKITLDVSDGEHQIHFTLTLAEDRLQGDVRMTNGSEERMAKLDVKRAK
jgi:hypothetical protein